MMLTIFQIRPARLSAASYCLRSKPEASSMEMTLIQGMRPSQESPLHWPDSADPASPLLTASAQGQERSEGTLEGLIGIQVVTAPSANGINGRPKTGHAQSTPLA